MTIIQTSTPGPQGATGAQGPTGATGPQGQQGVAGVGAKWQTGMSYTGLLATRCKAPTNGAVPGVANHMSRSIHTARDNITSLQIALANWYVANSLGEVASGGVANVTAAIEYPLGVSCHQLKFGGSVTGVMQDYNTFLSDALTISIPAGAQFAVREWRNYPNGGAVTFTNIVGIDSTDGNCYTYGGISTQTDVTMTPGTFSGGDGASFSAPVAIVGPTVMPSYALIGDSRGEGYGDTGNGNPDIGWLARSVGPHRAYTNLCKYGELTSTATGGAFAQREAVAAKWATHIICEYAVNDLYSGGQNTSQVLGMLETIWQKFPGKYFYQTTIMGEVASTDGFTTLGNQTYTNSNSNTFRNWLNNYLRSGITRFDGVFDATLGVETASNSGYWKFPGYTADGLHPTAVGYQAIASGGYITVA